LIEIYSGVEELKAPIAAAANAELTLEFVIEPWDDWFEETSR